MQRHRSDLFDIPTPTERSSLLARDSATDNSFYASTSVDGTRLSPADSTADPACLVASKPTEPDGTEEEWSQWWFSSLVLENTASVARDHLASERTFLAYVRTSLAVVSAGVALSQLLIVQMNELPQPTIGSIANILGAACVTLGLFILYQGRARYFSVQSALIKGNFPVARLGATSIAIALSLLVVTTFVVITMIQKT